MKTIKVPAVTWALGDAEQTTLLGVTVARRPLYYYPTPAHDAAADAAWPVRVGSIDPDYAGRLMDALNGGVAR